MHFVLQPACVIVGADIPSPLARDQHDETTLVYHRNTNDLKLVVHAPNISVSVSQPTFAGGPARR